MWSRTKANIGFVSFEIEPHRDKQTQIVAPRHTGLPITTFSPSLMRFTAKRGWGQKKKRALNVATSICGKICQLNEKKSTQIYLTADGFNGVGMPIILVSLHVVVVAIEYSNINNDVTGLCERHNGRI